MSGNALVGPEGRAVHSGIERRPGNICAGAADDALSAKPGASDRDYDCKRH